MAEIGLTTGASVVAGALVTTLVGRIVGSTVGELVDIEGDTVRLSYYPVVSSNLVDCGKCNPMFIAVSTMTRPVR